MFKQTEIKSGDKIFFFSSSPGMPNSLPFTIAKGVTLILKPNDVLSNNTLKNYSKIFHDASICISVSSRVIDQDEAFFLLVLCLRMVKPLPIYVSISFIYINENEIRNFSPWFRNTAINTGFAYQSGRVDRYSKEDFNRAKKLYKLIRRYKKQPQRYRRLIQAINWFKEVTTVNSASYSMLYQGLFLTLESLFFSPANGTELANKVSSFLETIYGKARTTQIKQFLYKTYELKRNSVAHGNQTFFTAELPAGDGKKKIPVEKNKAEAKLEKIRINKHLSKKKYEELLRLHEITRTTILGFLGLEPGELEKYSKLQKSEYWSSEKPTASKKLLSNSNEKRMHSRSPYKHRKG